MSDADALSHHCRETHTDNGIHAHDNMHSVASYIIDVETKSKMYSHMRINLSKHRHPLTQKPE